ncbi:hypothetical protein BTM25_34030 [Actinomadura rubteroloni]|uniref:Uncharacterized protein n=2 Tax=Actinomadura rubteroloni TaxID=1926885 RepID=A0A2P4UI91_9ACTN|nr:hypothetical protein BTM25_34030 [Actinomadura rubteroloni]
MLLLVTPLLAGCTDGAAKARERSAAQAQAFARSLPGTATATEIRWAAHTSRGIAIQSIGAVGGTTRVVLRSVAQYHGLFAPSYTVIFRCYRLDLSRRPRPAVTLAEISCTIPGPIRS